MKAEELMRLSDKELAGLWNDLASVFELRNGQNERPRPVVVGFFQLSRETDRRGLRLDKHEIFGDIILTAKQKT